METYDPDKDEWAPNPSHDVGTTTHRTYPQNQEETIVLDSSIDDNTNNQGENNENGDNEDTDDDISGNNEDTEDQESEKGNSETNEENIMNNMYEMEEFELPDLEDMNKESNDIKPKQKHSRELKNLGVTPKTSVPKPVQKLHTSYNTTYTEQTNMAIASDPGEPSTMKEALNGPEREKWKEAIKKEINNFFQ